MRLPIKELLPPSRMLRPVDMDGFDMTLLSDSIESCGLLVPITICNRTIVDGYRRWLVFKAKGWPEIECHSVEGDPDDLRIIAQTRNTVFGREEKRQLIGDLLARDRTVTAGDIAHRLQWSPIEVESMAGVDYLIPDFLAQYRAGELSLADVWQVSRCRDEGQLQLLEQPDDGPIYDRASAMHREIRSARRRSLMMKPRGKSLTAITREREKLTDAGTELIRSGAKTPLDGWIACLNWALSGRT